nr:integrase, catalytic region, zinc finger, CCHC-type, peptidase aspartic, catalytic [Tanacetum cinerariifolium]
MFPRRSEDEDSEYPFFEGDGSSSDEWRDYCMSVMIMKDLQYLMMINMQKNRRQFMIPILKMLLRMKKDLLGKEDLMRKKKMATKMSSLSGNPLQDILPCKRDAKCPRYVTGKVQWVTTHMTGNHALLTNFVKKFLGTVHFGNNDFAVIAGYGDVVIGAMTIKKVYFVEGLGHNLFSVGQFCEKGLE